MDEYTIIPCSPRKHALYKVQGYSFTMCPCGAIRTGEMPSDPNNFLLPWLLYSDETRKFRCIQQKMDWRS